VENSNQPERRSAPFEAWRKGFQCSVPMAIIRDHPQNRGLQKARTPSDILPRRRQVLPGCVASHPEHAVKAGVAPFLRRFFRSSLTVKCSPFNSSVANAGPTNTLRPSSHGGRSISPACVGDGLISARTNRRGNNSFDGLPALTAAAECLF